MTQTISQEAQAIIDFVEATGLPYRVTDVNGPGHAPNSYHYADGTDGVGLAVDFGGAIPGVTPATTAQMRAIYGALMNEYQQLAELIHNAPGITAAVHNGQIVDGAAFYGPATWAAHVNHVHVAVHRATFLSHPVVTLGGDAMTIVAAFPFQDGYVLVAANGAVYAFGCDFKGALQVGPNGEFEAVYPK